MSKIKGLQFVRLFAFVCVFVGHTAGSLGAIGSAGVSIFIVLSGYLMTYNYFDREIKTNPVLFALRKIKTLYPLHIAMMFIALIEPLILVFTYSAYSTLPKLLSQVLSNVFLVQPWVPNSSFCFSLNGVAWYLGLCLFLYLIFPFILKVLKKIDTKKAIFIGMAVVFAAEVCVSLVANFFTSPNISDYFSMHWLTYLFPVSRALDFIIGCFLGLIAVKYGRNASSKNPVLCAAALVAIIGSAVLAICGVPVFSWQWINCSLLFLPLSAILIYSFSGEKILLEKALCCKPVLFLCELTPYAFLIHQVAINLTKKLMTKLLGEGVPAECLSIAAALIITILLSVLYRKLVIWRKKKAKR